jgi:hypothetical protein
MAQTDLTGLLTGISSTPIDPMLNASLGQRAIARGEALGKSMRQNIGAFTGANTQTTNEKKEEALKADLSTLDRNSPTYNAELVEVVNKYDPVKAAALRQQLAESAGTDAGIGQINPQFYTAESISEFNNTYRQTGQKDYSLLKEIDKVGEAYKVGQMGDIRTAMAKRSESFSSAASLKGKTDTMRELLDTGLTTGALAGVSKSAKGFAQALFPDVEFKGLKEAEVFDALGSQLALLVRNPASDMGLPGATSNRDLDFLISTVPTLQKSVEGNKLLLEVYDAQYEFKKKIMAEQNRLIKENGGIPPIDLEQKLIAFYTNATVMSEELKAKISGISEDETRPTYDEKRLAELLGETGGDTTTETPKNVNPRGR